MSDSRPSPVVKSSLIGAAAGALGTAEVVKTAAATAVIIEEFNTPYACLTLLVHEGVTTWTVTGLATGALTGGVVAGSLAVVYLYRNEIAAAFTACCKNLMSLGQSLFGEVSKVWKWMTEIVKGALDILWKIYDKAESWVLNILKTGVCFDVADRKMVTDGIGRVMTDALKGIKEVMKPVAKKYGIVLFDVEKEMETLVKTGNESLVGMAECIMNEEEEKPDPLKETMKPGAKKQSTVDGFGRAMNNTMKDTTTPVAENHRIHVDDTKMGTFV